MVEGFPLSLPDGASAVDLAWDGQEQTRGDTCINSGNDQGWIIEASTGCKATATWVFGKVHTSQAVRVRLIRGYHWGGRGVLP